MLSQVDHVRPFSLGTCAHFINFYRESPSENITRQTEPFVVVTSFSWFSSKDSHEFPLKHNVFSSFLSKHILFPNEFRTFSTSIHVRIALICKSHTIVSDFHTLFEAESIFHSCLLRLGWSQQYYLLWMMTRCRNWFKMFFPKNVTRWFLELIQDGTNNGYLLYSNLPLSLRAK